MVNDRLIDKVDAIVDRLTTDESRLLKFLNASPWGIVVTNNKFIIQFVSKALEEMSGWKEHELIGHPIGILIPAESRRIHLDHEKRYAANPYTREGNHPLEPRLLKKDGEEVEVEISLGPTKVDREEYFFASVRLKESLPYQNDDLKIVEDAQVYAKMEGDSLSLQVVIPQDEKNS